MSSQQSEPKEGSSASSAVPPVAGRIPSSLWADFDADFTQPAFLNDAPTAPGRGVVRRPTMRLLRASSLPTSVQDGPRMTESEWQEIDQRLEGLYDFRRSQIYAPPLARSGIPTSSQQPSPRVIRSQTTPIAAGSATARPRMVLDDDSEEYVIRPRMVLDDDSEEYVNMTEARTRLRKRDILKLFGAKLAIKFKKLARSKTYNGRPATRG
ncbi:hypothetical protein Q9L58_004411 [Maublancomyces gigas]|uniref:Uncharacterized protein n=1 Tax=Discina gigas TaxID=1032678 RepID=A0ABR3GL18_9PEZI